MTEEVVVRLKRRISRHLRNEARLIQEMWRTYEAGELSDDEVKELNSHIVRVAGSLARKYPEYGAVTVGKGMEMMLRMLAALLRVLQER